MTGILTADPAALTTVPTRTHKVVDPQGLSNAVQWHKGQKGEGQGRRADPAPHDQLNALPLELLCGVDSNLAIIGAEHVIVSVHQSHPHDVLQRSQSCDMPPRLQTIWPRLVIVPSTSEAVQGASIGHWQLARVACPAP